MLCLWSESMHWVSQLSQCIGAIFRCVSWSPCIIAKGATLIRHGMSVKCFLMLQNQFTSNFLNSLYQNVNLLKFKNLYAYLGVINVIISRQSLLLSMCNRLIALFSIPSNFNSQNCLCRRRASWKFKLVWASKKIWLEHYLNISTSNPWVVNPD